MITAGIFKANDIRGVIGAPGAEWDLDGVRAVGAAFVEVLPIRIGVAYQDTGKCDRISVLLRFQLAAVLGHE